MEAEARMEAETRVKAAAEPRVESETTTSAAPLSMSRSGDERSREGQHNCHAELHVGLLLLPVVLL
jgi:hypothetical protein